MADFSSLTTAGDSIAADVKAAIEVMRPQYLAQGQAASSPAMKQAIFMVALRDFYDSMVNEGMSHQQVAMAAGGLMATMVADAPDDIKAQIRGCFATGFDEFEKGTRR